MTFQVSFPSTSSLAPSAIANTDQFKPGSLEIWISEGFSLLNWETRICKNHSSFTFLATANPPKEATMASRLRIRTQLFVIMAHAQTQQEISQSLIVSNGVTKCDGTPRISTPLKRSDGLHVLLGV